MDCGPPGLIRFSPRRMPARLPSRIGATVRIATATAINIPVIDPAIRSVTGGFVADTTFLPCGPSVLDLRAANEAIRVVRQAQTIRKGPPRVVLIPNKLQVHYRLSRELLETGKALDIPSTSGLRLRQAYADAAGQGKVVWQMGPRAEDAAREIRELFEELLAYEAGGETNHERSVANR